MKQNRVKSIITAVTLTVLTTAGHAQTTCSETPTRISVGANRLDKALAELSGQITCTIRYDRKVAQTFRSPAVKGNLTPSDALIQLVKGTGLEVHTDASLALNQADQEAIGLRAATLQANLGQAVKSQKLGQQTANQMFGKLGDVRTSVVELAKKQGFVSAAEKASYTRVFNEAEHLLASGK